MNQYFRSVSVPVLVIGLLMASGNFKCNGQSWDPLFNGENLEGWSVKCLPSDMEKEYWKVHDGYIECNSTGDRSHNYVWLATERSFADFHLTLEFQVFRSSTGNSGVQFRSSYDDSDTARYGGWLSGPQADIHGPLPMRTGLIYDETENVRRWIYPSLPNWEISEDQIPAAARETWLVYVEDDPDAWNAMEIICEGMRVMVKVNGNPATDFNGEGILNDELHRIRNAGTEGCIALQLHQNDELRIRYREILIREI